jgi:hypothetical protein
MEGAKCKNANLASPAKNENAKIGAITGFRNDPGRRGERRVPASRERTDEVVTATRRI